MTPDEIRQLRKVSGLTQERFVQAFGLSLRTLQGWEQGRDRLAGAALVYLKVISLIPDQVRAALDAARLAAVRPVKRKVIVQKPQTVKWSEPQDPDTWD